MPRTQLTLPQFHGMKHHHFILQPPFSFSLHFSLLSLLVPNLIPLLMSGVFTTYLSKCLPVSFFISVSNEKHIDFCFRKCTSRVLCSKSILFLSFFFQAILLNVVSAFFPVSFLLYNVRLYVWCMPHFDEHLWSPIPGNPNAILNHLAPWASVRELSWDTHSGVEKLCLRVSLCSVSQKPDRLLSR